MSSFPAPPPPGERYGPDYETYQRPDYRYPPTYPAGPQEPHHLWSADLAAPPPRRYWPPFKSVVIFGRFVLGAVALVAVTDLFEIAGRVREYRVAGDLQDDLDSVSLDRVVAIDDFIRAERLASLVTLLIAAVATVVWFYRVRWNAGAYGTHEQRRSQGWAVGGWFCPIIALFYPYQMTTDIVGASEADPGPPTRYPVTVSLVRAWWVVWLIDDFFSVTSRISSSNTTTFGEVRTADVVDIASSVVDICAAVLFALVVLRIDRAQRRWPAKAQAVAETTGQPTTS